MSKTSSKRVNNFIKKATWTFAKTYAKTTPHEYCIKDKLPKSLEEEFDWFASHIKENGYIEYFFRTPFTYLNVDGYKYWAMGEKGKLPNIINRTDIRNRYS